ncbi:MAG: hypothetical protein NHB32_30760 [Fischerella sp. CENA71]|nr:hypothetical protein [Fischerella sp. CENA71]
MDKSSFIPSQEQQQNNTCKFEVILIIVLCILFLLVGLVIASRIEPVWTDEVMFTDPPNNLYFGKGWISTAWYYQTKEEFWAGNLPLHEIILYHWLKIFGFSLTAVRSMNYFLIVASVLMLWLSVIRLKLINSPWSRIALICLILSSSGISFSYSSGRADSIAITVASAALLAYTITSPWLRCVTLACIGIFIPIAGLQLLAYVIVLCGVLVFYLRKLLIKELVSLGIGAVLGIIFLYTLYFTNGVWFKFILSTFGSQHILTGQVAQAIVQGDDKGILKILSLQKVFIIDFSTAFLHLLTLTLVIYQLLKRQFKFYSLISFGFVGGLFIPLAIVIAGKYPHYYTWMAFIPMAICICSELDNFSLSGSKKWINLTVVLILLIASLGGFPAKASLAINEWETRDYANVEAFVQKNVKKTDWVYCDYGAYYAAYKSAELVFLPSYARMLSKEEKQKITTLIINPNNLKEITNKLGGDWRDTGEALIKKSLISFQDDTNNYFYNLRVFKRKSVS